MKKFITLCIFALVQAPAFAGTLQLGAEIHLSAHKLADMPTGQIDSAELWILDAPFSYRGSEVNVDAPTGSFITVQSNAYQGQPNQYAFKEGCVVTNAHIFNCTSNLPLSVNLYGTPVDVERVYFYFDLKISNLTTKSEASVYVPELRTSLHGIHTFFRGEPEGFAVGTSVEVYRFSGVNTLKTVDGRPLKIRDYLSTNLSDETKTRYLLDVNPVDPIELTSCSGKPFHYPGEKSAGGIVFDEAGRVTWDLTGTDQPVPYLCDGQSVDSIFQDIMDVFKPDDTERWKTVNLTGKTQNGSVCDLQILMDRIGLELVDVTGEIEGIDSPVRFDAAQSSRILRYVKSKDLFDVKLSNRVTDLKTAQDTLETANFSVRSNHGKVKSITIANSKDQASLTCNF